MDLNQFCKSKCTLIVFLLSDTPLHIISSVPRLYSTLIYTNSYAFFILISFFVFSASRPPRSFLVGRPDLNSPTVIRPPHSFLVGRPDLNSPTVFYRACAIFYRFII
ncbi:unnamed protein product [Adineta ricciae]|uniref:Uncharacterized protein n=1 Tax=Adineta ricciae TaxID=249248 RepID=A0A815Z634_ADIRI|nr:unnamed protein product [Adineta ricciae]